VVIAEPVVRRDGASIEAASVVAVLVHGRDQDAGYMQENLVEPVQRPDTAYLMPEAPSRSWYAGRFSDPVPTLEPALSSALSAIEAAVAVASQASVPVVLAGFSQGACLVAELLGRRGRMGLAGAAVLTGALIGERSRPEEVRRLEVRFDGLPVELVSSELDEWVGPEFVGAAARSLADAGAAVHLQLTWEPEHRIDDVAVAAVARLLYGAAGTTTR
jgi:phospholipase/carboxylesterase